MSILESSSAAIAAMASFSPALKVALEKKRKEAALADNTKLLNNRSEASIRDEGNVQITNHLTQRNPHGLQASQLNAYSYKQFEDMLAGLPRLSSIPVDRFGELNYLPLSVGGSYEGATMNFDMRQYAMIIEDDGTMVYLRNGTNGSTRGVYYAYMLDVLGAVKAPIRTTRRYEPSFVPAGKYIRFIQHTAGQYMMGVFADKATDAYGDSFIAEINGTMDATKHRGCFIAKSFQFAPGMGPLSWVKCKDGIYGFATLSGGASWEIIVYKLPLEFQEGQYVTPQRVTGFSGLGINGVAFNDKTNITTANAVATNGEHTAAVMNLNNIPWQIVNVFYSGQCQLAVAVDEVTGYVRVRISGDCFMMVKGTVITPWVSYSLVVRPEEKTFTMDGRDQTAVMQVNGGGYPYVEVAPRAVIHSGRGASSTGGNISGIDSHCWHRAGYWFGISDYQLPDISAYMGRNKPANGATTAFQGLDTTLEMNASVTLFILPEYGSAFGNLFSGLTPLPNNRYMTNCYGKNAVGVMKSGLVLATPGAIGWKYKSIGTPGGRDGYAPNVFRKFAADLGKVDAKLAYTVSVIDTLGQVTAGCGHFVEGGNVENARGIDGDLNEVGTISVSQGVFNSVRPQVLSKLVDLGKPAYPSKSVIGIVITQNAQMPIFGYMHWFEADKVERMVFFDMALTGGSRTGAMTAFVVGNAFSNVFPVSTAAVSIANDNVLAATTGGICVTLFSDGIVVSGVTKTYTNRQNYGGGALWRFAIPTGSTDWWSTLKVYETTLTGAWPNFSSIPGVGCVTLIPEDLNTKLVYRPACRSVAEYAAWDRPAVWQALFTQDMPQGFILYFSSPVPMLMAGKVYTVPAATIDLNGLVSDPSNKTFYVYITINSNGVPQYEFYLAKTPESATVMYIGTIKTNSLNIESINLTKVTRIHGDGGYYRPSSVPQGSSFMVTNGSPDVPTSTAW